jgi:RNA 2',3'-cyclic 3'-phosphodiesterase
VNSLRLFFALWPSEDMQSALAKTAEPAVRAADGRAIPAQNLHSTLAFLGAVPQSRFDSLGPIADDVATRWRRRAAPAIALTLDGIEHWRRAEILCACASVMPPAATDLASGLKDALLAGGFAPDLKPFRAHVTLARKVARARDAAMTPVVWSFDSFALVASQTAPSGSSYSVVGTWALAEKIPVISASRDASV